eukprot:XP_011662393.1 PREDICTED: uncharacterized protein LOC587339 [Strongylocentrotus purpuratus]
MDPKDILKTYSSDAMKFNPPLPPKHPVISKKALKTLRYHRSKASKSFVQEDFQALADRCDDDDATLDALGAVVFSSTFSSTSSSTFTQDMDSEDSEDSEGDVVQRTKRTLEVTSEENSPDVVNKEQKERDQINGTRTKKMKRMKKR